MSRINRGLGAKVKAKQSIMTGRTDTEGKMADFERIMLKRKTDAAIFLMIITY